MVRGRPDDRRTRGRRAGARRSRPAGRSRRDDRVGHRPRRRGAAVGGQLDDHQRRVGEPRHHGDFDCAARRRGPRRLGEVRARWIPRRSRIWWRRPSRPPTRRPRPGTRRPAAGRDCPADWDAPIAGTGCEVFGGVAKSLARGFGGADTLYGYARHIVGDDVRRDLGRAAAAIHAAHRFGGDQRQTCRRQRLGGRQHARFPSVCQRIPCSTDLATRLGWARRTVELPAGPLRDDHAAVDGGGHDDLPGVDDGRPGRPGGPHCAVGARRRDPGGGAAHRRWR